MCAMLMVGNQIGNVPNDLSEDVIGPYFHSLAALPDDSSPAQANSQSASNTGSAIQTIYYRFQEKRAIILAFYDIRDAERVKHLIEANGSHPHYGTDLDDEQRISHESTTGCPWVKALTCLFVAPDHFLQVGLARILSRSRFSTSPAPWSVSVSYHDTQRRRILRLSGWNDGRA